MDLWCEAEGEIKIRYCIAWLPAVGTGWARMLLAFWHIAGAGGIARVISDMLERNEGSRQFGLTFREAGKCICKMD